MDAKTIEEFKKGPRGIMAESAEALYKNLQILYKNLNELGEIERSLLVKDSYFSGQIPRLFKRIEESLNRAELGTLDSESRIRCIIDAFNYVSHFFPDEHLGRLFQGYKEGPKIDGETYAFESNVKGFCQGPRGLEYRILRAKDMDEKATLAKMDAEIKEKEELYEWSRALNNW